MALPLRSATWCRGRRRASSSSRWTRVPSRWRPQRVDAGYRPPYRVPLGEGTRSGVRRGRDQGFGRRRSRSHPDGPRRRRDAARSGADRQWSAAARHARVGRQTGRGQAGRSAARGSPRSPCPQGQARRFKTAYAVFASSGCRKPRREAALHTAAVFASRRCRRLGRRHVRTALRGPSGRRRAARAGAAAAAAGERIGPILFLGIDRDRRRSWRAVSA